MPFQFPPDTPELFEDQAPVAPRYWRIIEEAEIRRLQAACSQHDRAVRFHREQHQRDWAALLAAKNRLREAIRQENASPVTVRGDCGIIHSSVQEWKDCIICDRAIRMANAKT